MTATRETMTDEDRKALVIEYLKAFDRAGVTSDGGSILDLFADDAKVYFPKWGVAHGREQIGQMFGDVGATLKAIEHHGTEDPPLLHLPRPGLRRPGHRALPLAGRPAAVTARRVRGTPRGCPGESASAGPGWRSWGRVGWAGCWPSCSSGRGTG
jgi:hypothetical protein